MRIASLATAYIYVSLLESQSKSKTIKLILPRSIDQLKKQAAIVLNVADPILTLMNEDGTAIKSTEDILPGTTILCSTEIISTPMPEPKPKSNEGDTLTLHLDPNEEAIYNQCLLSDISLEEEEYLDEEADEEEEIPDSDDVQQSKPSSKHSTPDSKTPKEDQEEEIDDQLSDDNSEIEEEHYDMDSENIEEDLLEDQNSETDEINQLDKELIEEEDDAYQETNEIEEEEEENIIEIMHEEEFSDESIESSAASDALSTVFSGSPSVCNQVLHSLKESDQESLDRESCDQREFFQNVLSSLQSVKDRDNFIMVNSLLDRSQKFIQSHRLVVPTNTLYSFQTIILGPRQSGKSTYLSFFAESFLADLIASSTWKRNLVITFDAKQLAASFTSIFTFYNSFVSLVFNSIKLQRPGFAPHCDGVIKYFQSIQSGSVLPKQFEQDFKQASRHLVQLSQQLKTCLECPTAYQAWLTNVMLFPSLVGTAFGFSQVYFFVDHLEYLDYSFPADSIFSESDWSVSLIEVFRFAVSSSSFVFAAEKSSELLERFPLGDAEIIDTFGLEGDFTGQDMAFMVKFEGDPRNIRITANDCGGCAAYLQFWAEICRETKDNKKEWNVPVSEYNDQQMTVKKTLEYLMKLLFVEGEFEGDAIIKKDIVSIKPVTLAA